jgi:hypothetical protein
MAAAAAAALYSKRFGDSGDEKHDEDLALSWISLQLCEALDLLHCGAKRRRLTTPYEDSWGM